TPEDPKWRGSESDKVELRQKLRRAEVHEEKPSSKLRALRVFLVKLDNLLKKLNFEGSCYTQVGCTIADLRCKQLSIPPC
ncbi:MAG: hypothetical protein WCH01_06540, partial [Methylococcaceae bacterium]